MVLFFYLFLIMVLCHFCCVCYFGKGAEKGVAGKNCWMGAAKFSVFTFSGKPCRAGWFHQPAVRCQIESLILRVSLARDPRGLAPDLASLIPRVTPSANPRYHESIGFSDDGHGAVSAGEGGGWDVFLYRGD